MNLNINSLSKHELTELISQNLVSTDSKLVALANDLRNQYYGRNVFLRGLIEFTSYCKNDCFYCGLRKSNEHASRYRLTGDIILSCCAEGYKLGFRSFVLQGGEDDYFEDDKFTEIIYRIKNKFPDCALTVSFGEKDKEAYRKYKAAGAERYLLRHETADNKHYSMLHPKSLSPVNRKKCLYDLKELGFQVGAGFMVGSPFQTAENLVEDLLFLKDLNPQMVGIGPFIPHKDTPFNSIPIKSKYDVGEICKNYFKNSNTHYLLNATVSMVALTRCLLPKALLPSTTALATISENGRAMALKAGANVVMPNLSPVDLRKSYNIYDNKAYSLSEAAESVKILSDEITSIGYVPSFTRGDHIDLQ